MNFNTALFCEFDKYAAESYCAIHGVSPALNIGDITKADEKTVPDFNVMFGGSPCFPAGTHVLTSKGYRNIENLSMSDKIYTKEHRFKPVVRIGSDGEKEVLTIMATGILPIECTPNHPFWIKKKVTFWDKTVQRNIQSLSEARKVRAEDIEQGDYICVPIIKDMENDLTLLDSETLWLLGRYVADGHLSNRGITLSIGKNKIDTFEDIETTHSIYPHTASCYRVIFKKSSSLYSIITHYDFGTNALEKNIPMEVLTLPREKLEHFLDGYWSGDGCSVSNTNIRQATTISRRLAETLVLAIQKVYRTGCKIYFTKRPVTCEIEGRTVNQHDTYMVRYLTKSAKNSFFVEDDCIWYPIKRIVRDGTRKVIYNIEVADDHTYIANGATVFNCQDFSVAGKQKGAVWTCSHCGHTYNPLEAHYTKRDACPICGAEDIEKTRSSLLVEWLRFLREKKPRFAIYENVKNITGSRFRPIFERFVKELEDYGYHVYWQVLNAKHYGIPQNRERVYCVIIRKDLDNGKFEFPSPIPLKKTLADMLDDHVDERYYLSDDKVAAMINPPHSDQSAKPFDLEVEAPQTDIHGTCSLSGVKLSKKGTQFEGYCDTALTLLARDHKGFGNQQMTGVLEQNESQKLSDTTCRP